MRAMLVAAAVLVAGCAAHFQKTMDKDVKALVGKNIGSVVDKLGYPSNKLTIGGDTVYVWADADGCTLHIGADASGSIVRSDYDGGRRDCDKYYNALDSLYEDSRRPR